MQEIQYIHVNLLQPHPQISIEGKLLELPGQPLDALIYFAVNAKSSYTNRELLTIFFAGDEKNRHTLRKHIRPHLRKALRSYFGDNQIIRVESEYTYLDNLKFKVDAHLFKESVDRLVQRLELGVVNRTAILETLELYRTDFLSGHHYSLIGLNPTDKIEEPYLDSDLTSWHSLRQKEYAHSRNRLLDKYLQYLLTQEHFHEVFERATHWYQQAFCGVIPLQYLILAANRLNRHSDVEHYLVELQKIEDTGQPVVGPSLAQWRTYLKEYQRQLPLWILSPKHSTPEVPYIQLEMNPKDFFGRKDEINTILSRLTENNHLQGLVLFGSRGIGKTALVERIIEYLRNVDLYKIVYIAIKATTNLNNLLEEVALQIQHLNHDMTSSSNAIAYIENQFKRHKYILILDSDSILSYSLESLIYPLFEIIGISRIVVSNSFDVTIKKDFMVDHIQLGGLRIEAINSFLRTFNINIFNRSPHFGQKLHQITDGLPTLVKPLAVLISKNFLPIESISKIRMPNSVTTEERYGIVWDFLWNYLMPWEKQLLVLLAIADEASGLKEDEIVRFFPDIDTSFLREKLRNLVQRGFVRQSIDVYKFVPYLHGSVLQIVHEEQQDSVLEIYLTFAKYYIDAVTQHDEKSDWFCLYETSILRAFEIGIQHFERDTALKDIVVSFRPVYRYLDFRGKFKIAERFLIALDMLVISDEHRALVCHWLGITFIKTTKLDMGLEQLHKAHTFAKKASDTHATGLIDYDIATIYMRLGQYEQAYHYLEIAYQWALNHDNQDLICRIIIVRAKIAYEHGQMEEARKLYLQVLKISESIEPEPLDLIDYAHIWLGSIAENQENYTLAKKYFETSLEYAIRTRQLEKQGYAYMDLGVVDYHLSEFTSAQDYFHRALSISESIQNKELRILILSNQGKLNIARGAQYYDEAERLLRQSLIEAKSLDLHWQILVSLVGLGKLYLRQHNYSKAQNVFIEVIYSEPQNSKFLCHGLYGLLLTILQEKYLVGIPDIETVMDMVTVQLKDLKIEVSITQKISMLDFEFQLEQATRLFQHDMKNIPQLEQFKVREILTLLLNSEY